MIEVSNIRLPLDAGLPDGEKLVRSAVANVLGVKVGAITDLKLLKRSVDARKKNDVGFVATYAVGLSDAQLEKRALEGVGVSKRVNVKVYEPYEPLEIPCFELSESTPRPVVVGTGPAGLFAGLYLARAGLRPLVVERGGNVEERQRAVAAFNEGADLDLATNIQFGEGGAGTFSDGKLTTGTKSPLARHVLQWFVDAGAPDEILWQAKPHIGTDKLVEVYVYSGTGSMTEVNGKQPGEFLDYAIHDYGGMYDVSSSYPGLSKKGMILGSSEFARGSKISAYNCQRIVEGGYGGTMIFSLAPEHTDLYCMNRIAKAFYDDEVVQTGSYSKDW